MKSNSTHQISVADMQYGAANSRRLLVDTVQALTPFQDAVTVVGAHAIHIWIEQTWGKSEMQATRDGDIVLNPRFVTEDPKLIDLMASIGIIPILEDRPGIYGYKDEIAKEWIQRTTVDLIVPEAYAGPGRRAARIAGQRHAASRAIGLELAIWDRTLTKLTTTDEPIESAEAYVAGPAALLTAKAHKVYERLAEIATKPQRLKPKDSGDVALLMMISDPEEVAQIMLNSAFSHPEIKSVIYSAATWLVDMYQAKTSIPRLQAIASLESRFEEAEVASAIDNWLDKFSTAFSQHSHETSE